MAVIPVYHDTDIGGSLTIISAAFRDAVYAATGTSTLAELKAIFGFSRVLVVTTGQTLAVDNPAQMGIACGRAITGFEPMCAAPTYLAATILASVDGNSINVRDYVTPGAGTTLVPGPTNTFIPVYSSFSMACEGGPAPTADSATQYNLTFGIEPGQAFTMTFGGNVASKGGNTQSSRIIFTFATLDVLEDSDVQTDPNGGGGGIGGGVVDPPVVVRERRTTIQVSWGRFYNSYAVTPPGSNTLPPQKGGPTPV